MTPFNYQLVEDTAKSFTFVPENFAPRCSGSPEKGLRKGNEPDGQGDPQDHPEKTWRSPTRKTC